MVADNDLHATPRPPSKRSKQAKQVSTDKDDQPHIPPASTTASRFSYSEISSLVLKSDRSSVPRRDQEVGKEEVESLWGKVSTKEMGLRASRDAAPTIAKSIKGITKSSTKESSKWVPGMKKPLLEPTTARSIHMLGEDEEFEGLNYRPRTQESRQAYEEALSVVTTLISSDQGEEVARGALDEVITILRHEGTGDSTSTSDGVYIMSDEARRERIARVLGTFINADLYATLASICARLTDYGVRVEEKVKVQKRDIDNVMPIVFDEEGDQGVENFDDTPAVILQEEGEEAADGAELKNEPLPFILQGWPEGGHTLTKKDVHLPSGSQRIYGKGWEGVSVPAPPTSSRPDDLLIDVQELPGWMHPGLVGLKHLNRVQSQVAPAALESDGNLLVCAPTGAGKTIVALLCMLREIGKRINSPKVFDLASFDPTAFDDLKMVYIAPMKALVHEMCSTFTRLLRPYGIIVSELTGESHLTHAQLRSTHLIVSTPEKWDIVTRKETELSLTKRHLRLMIIDEVHLLHDDRGPVLESIIMRTLLRGKEFENDISSITRIVSLSATLPNYEDVAQFVQTLDDRHVFFFDASYRPCPLSIKFMGLTEERKGGQGAFKRYQLMNELTLDMVKRQLLGDDGQFSPASVASSSNQILIFVHSRKDTAKTARYLKNSVNEDSSLTSILHSSLGYIEKEVDSIKSRDLRELLTSGIGIHHAGLSKQDRHAVERLFREGYLTVLVATSTLAWGVNLPAHTVIIKGTQIYSPVLGTWTELSNQDILQMLGRAGRPQYDTQGEGIIITTHSEMMYYVSLMTTQLPIESQFVKHLPDALNAEVQSGTVENISEALDWLKTSYLAIRACQEPKLYHVATDYESDGEDTNSTVLRENALDSYLNDLLCASATLLGKAGMVIYDRRTGVLHPAPIGRIASHYYIKHSSVAIYQTLLRSSMDIIDLLALMARSDEFKFLPIRADERVELGRLLERVPIPIRETPDDPISKINCLLQVYISRLTLDHFALSADLTYIAQSAPRLARALLEMAMEQGWAKAFRRILDLSKSLEQRLWQCQIPLRQLAPAEGDDLDIHAQCILPEDLLDRLERKDFPWHRLADLSIQELAELYRVPKQARTLHRAIHAFPRIDISAQVLPLSSGLLSINLTLTPDFDWSMNACPKMLWFWLLVEDVSKEKLYFAKRVAIKRKVIKEAEGQVSYQSVELALLISGFALTTPLIFLSCHSDKYLHCFTDLAIPLMKMILPKPIDIRSVSPHDSLVKDDLMDNEDVEWMFKGMDWREKGIAVLGSFDTRHVLEYLKQLFPQSLVISCPSHDNSSLNAYTPVIIVDQIHRLDWRTEMYLTSLLHGAKAENRPLPKIFMLGRPVESADSLAQWTNGQLRLFTKNVCGTRYPMHVNPGSIDIQPYPASLTSHMLASLQSRQDNENYFDGHADLLWMVMNKALSKLCQDMEKCLLVTDSLHLVDLFANSSWLNAKRQVIHVDNISSMQAFSYDLVIFMDTAIDNRDDQLLQNLHFMMDAFTLAPRATLFTHRHHMAFYFRHLMSDENTLLPLESQLDQHLTIETVDSLPIDSEDKTSQLFAWLTCSFMACRLAKNPSYYGLLVEGIDQEGELINRTIAEHLSELVDQLVCGETENNAEQQNQISETEIDK